MRIFLDTEFTEDGRTIELISIGLVSEAGKSYYAQALDWDPGKASPWVRANVLPHLKRCSPELSLEAELEAHRGRGGCSSFCPWRAKTELRLEIHAFAGVRPEFWADFAAYDWIALCQLYGTMMDLPVSWPMFCRDIQQLRDQLGGAELPRRAHAHTPEHFALNDALDCLRRWRHLELLRRTVSA